MLRALRNAVPSAMCWSSTTVAPTARRRRQSNSPKSSAVSKSLHARSEKSGLGGAYRAGFSWGLERGYDISLRSTATLSHDPAALPTLLDAAGNHDVVIGSRYVKGGHIPQWTFFPGASIHLAREAISTRRSCWDLKVADSNGGFSADVLEERAREDGLRDGERERLRLSDRMTYRARRAGLSIIEVPNLLHRPRTGRVQDVRCDRGRGARARDPMALLRPFGPRHRVRRGRPAPRTARSRVLSLALFHVRRLDRIHCTMPAPAQASNSVPFTITPRCRPTTHRRVGVEPAHGTRVVAAVVLLESTE